MKNNFKLFSDELDDLIANSKVYKNTKKYEVEMTTFKNYLIYSKLGDKVFVLNEEQVDEYFLYCQNMNKLGSKSTLNTQISALKCIFEYLIDRGLKYNDLFGYISTQKFRNAIANRLKDNKRKDLISINDIKLILEKLTQYFDKNNFALISARPKQERYIKVLVANLYIKLNLILPLKVSEMLDITFNEFSDDFRIINYNNFKLKIPNSLHKDISYGIRILKEKYNIKYTPNDYVFKTFAKSITDKFDTGKISSWISVAMNNIVIHFSKDEEKRYTFSVEKIKKSALWNMINNGINIVYLSDLTGLSLDSLSDDNIFDYNNEIASTEINGTYNNLEYYQYL